jgi:N-acetylglucosamine kinase-like BadF-type ATPase
VSEEAADLVVEGGGSHTLVGVRRDGRIERSLILGSTNPFAVGQREAAKRMERIVKDYGAKLNQPFHVYVAHGFASTPSRARILGEALSSLLTGSNDITGCTVVNDLVPLACLEPSQDTVVCNVGTGTGFIARTSGGKWARASGLEYLLSDEGGGADIGLKVLRACVRHSDGRGMPTLLTELVRNELACGAGEEFVDVLFATIYGRVEEAKIVASRFAPLLFAAAEAGDQMANEILVDITHELCLGVKAVSHKLSVDVNRAVVVMSGSVLTENAMLQSLIASRLGFDPGKIRIAPTGSCGYLNEWIAAWQSILAAAAIPIEIPIYSWLA